MHWTCIFTLFSFFLNLRSANPFETVILNSSCPVAWMKLLERQNISLVQQILHKLWGFNLIWLGKRGTWQNSGISRYRLPWICVRYSHFCTFGVCGMLEMWGILSWCVWQWENKIRVRGVCTNLAGDFPKSCWDLFPALGVPRDGSWPGFPWALCIPVRLSAALWWTRIGIKHKGQLWGLAEITLEYNLYNSLI